MGEILTLQNEGSPKSFHSFLASFLEQNKKELLKHSELKYKMNAIVKKGTNFLVSCYSGIIYLHRKIILV